VTRRQASMTIIDKTLKIMGSRPACLLPIAGPPLSAEGGEVTVWEQCTLASACPPHDGLATQSLHISSSSRVVSRGQRPWETGLRLLRGWGLPAGGWDFFFIEYVFDSS
jgi:hypothetical protein